MSYCTRCAHPVEPRRYYNKTIHTTRGDICEICSYINTNSSFCQPCYYPSPTWLLAQQIPLQLETDEHGNTQWICLECGLSDGKVAAISEEGSYEEAQEERGGKSDYLESMLREVITDDRQVTITEERKLDELTQVRVLSRLQQRMIHVKKRMQLIEELVLRYINGLYTENQMNPVVVIPESKVGEIMEAAKECIKKMEMNQTRNTILNAMLCGVAYYYREKVIEVLPLMDEVDKNYYVNSIISAIKLQYTKWDLKAIKESQLKDTQLVTLNKPVESKKKRKSTSSSRSEAKRQKKEDAIHKQLEYAIQKTNFKKKIFQAQPLVIATPSIKVESTQSISIIATPVEPTSEFKQREQLFNRNLDDFDRKRDEFFARHYVDSVFHDLTTRMQYYSDCDIPYSSQFSSYPDLFFNFNHIHAIARLARNYRIIPKELQLQFHIHVKLYEKLQEPSNVPPSTFEQLDFFQPIFTEVETRMKHLLGMKDISCITEFALSTMKAGVLYNDHIIAACVLYHVALEKSIRLQPNVISTLIDKNRNNVTRFHKELQLFKARLNCEMMVDIGNVWNGVIKETIEIRQQMTFISPLCIHGSTCECYGLHVSKQQLEALYRIDVTRIRVTVDTIERNNEILQKLQKGLEQYIQGYGMNRLVRRYAPESIAHMILYCALKHRTAQPHIKPNRKEIILKPITKEELPTPTKDLMKELGKISETLILRVNGDRKKKK